MPPQPDPRTVDPKTASAVLDALRRVPGLNLAELAAAHIVPLKGLSNLSFLVKLASGGLVVRLAQSAPGSYANREDEIAAARLAMRLGIAPRLVFADAASGLMVSEYVEVAAAPGGDSGALARMGAALGALHRCGEVLPGRYDIFAVIANYEGLLRAVDRALPDWPPAVAAQLAKAKTLLKAGNRPLAPCHNDPVPQNFLNLGNRAMLIDWEYAGMNDPAFDLAYLSLEAELTPQAERALLSAQGEAAVHAPLLPHYKFLICVMSALWGRLHDPGAGWQAWAARREALAAELAEHRDLG